MILKILLFVAVLMIIVLSYIVYRLSKRLLEFDDLFELLTHDIEVNVKYFKKLLSTPLLENAPEIITVHKNMGIIAERLDEFVNRMEETANRELRAVEPEEEKG